MNTPKLFALVALALMPVTVRAATKDFQLWANATAQGKLAPDVVATAELVTRTVDDVGRLGQLELRGVLGTPLSKSVTIGIGFVHIITYNQVGRDILEETPFAQVNWSMGKFLGGTLSSRTRLEDRFTRGASKMALRMRSQIKWSRRLTAGGPSAVVWVEPFYSFNRTSAVRPGVDQLRSFAGLNFKLSKALDADVGYLNQYQNRATGDRSNHAVSVNLGFKF